MSESNSNDFDPYRVWLGIPEREQPPNRYRLLGIVVFEDDPQVIESAADRQMTHVRTFQNGKYRELSQQLLNELSAAKVKLLDPGAKARYDDKLRSKRAKSKSGAVPTAPPAPPVAGVGAPMARPVNTPQSAPAAGIAAPGMAPPVSVPGAAPVASAAPVAAPVEYGGAPSAPVPVSAPSPPVGGPSVSSRGGIQNRRKSSPLPLIMGLGAVGALGMFVLAAIVFSGAGGEAPTSDDSSETTSTDHEDGGLSNSIVEKRPNPPTRRPRDKASDTDQLTSTLLDARRALARRDMDKTLSLLAKAESLAEGSNDASRIAHIRSMRERLTSFWAGVRQGAEGISEGDKLSFDGHIALFQSIDEDQVTWMVDGSEETRSIYDLPTAALEELAQRGLPQDDARRNIYIGSFLAVDEGGKTKRGNHRTLSSMAEQRVLAKEYFERAAQLGQADPVLAKEVGGETPADAPPIDNTAATDPEDEPPAVDSAGVELLDNLPELVQLPKVADASPIDIASWEEATPATWKLELSNDLVDVRGGSFRAVEGDKDADGQHWSIHLTGPGGETSGRPAVAEMTFGETGVRFNWSAEAAGSKSAEQLRNAFAKFTIGNEVRQLPLREPTQSEVILLDMTKLSTLHPWFLTAAPKVGDVMLELTSLDGLDTAASFKDDKSTAEIGEQVVILFDEVPGAEMRVKLQRDDQHGVAVQVESFYVNDEGNETPLSTVTVRNAENDTRRKILQLQNTQAILRNRIVAAQAQLRAAKKDEKKALADSFEKGIEQAKANIEELQTQILAFNTDYQKFPTVFKFVSALNGKGRLEYRLYASSDDQEVTFVEAFDVLEE